MDETCTFPRIGDMKPGIGESLDPAPSATTTPPPFAAALVLGLAGAVLIAHLLVNLFSPYGFHRDEFLYMAMGRHLRLFRMDFPPLIAILSEASRLLGDHLVFLRLTPAIAGAALVGFAGLFAREFGGDRFAQALAALAVATSPLFLRSGNLFQPVVFDQLWWTLGLFALARLGRAGFPAGSLWWVVLGIAGGVGLLTKFTILVFGAGVLVGLLLSPARRVLTSRGPWLAVAIALVLGSPSLVGQLRLGFPVLAQMDDLRGAQLERVTYLDFVVGQVLMLGPAFALALVGIAALLTFRSLRPFRAVGGACAATFLIVMLLHGKPYYIGPIYPALLGAGAAVLAAWIGARRAAGRRRLARTTGAVAVALVAIYGVVTLPLGLPFLPPASMAHYGTALGVAAAVETNRGEILQLPQDYADMLGWEAQVRAVYEVYRALSPDDRRQAVIVADNYGEAGAIDYFGPRHGLPAAVVPVGSYWFFGPGEKPGTVVIKIGGTRDDLLHFCRSVTLAARVDEPWVVPEERNLPIWICREPYGTLQEIWPEFEGQN